MTVDAWLTIAVLGIAVALMVADLVSPPEGILGAVVALLILGVISFEEAFQGFSSTAAITIAAYYVVAAAIEKTGALAPVIPYLLGRGRRPRLGLARLTVPSAAASGFVSNTPIVAMMIEPIQTWSRRTGVPASKLLIPLSYATILGGTITLIGTSTNLLVSDLVAQSGGEAFGFFSTAAIGLPVAVVGLLLIVVLAPWAMPDRGDEPTPRDKLRTYTMSMRVDPSGAFDGATLDAQGLGHLGLDVMVRDGETVEGADADTRLAGGDLLRLQVQADDAVELSRRGGLTNTLSEGIEEVPGGRATFYEAVVSGTSSLIGERLRDADLPGGDDAAPVAVLRAGRRIRSHDLGDLKIRDGDTLLVLAPRGYRQDWRNRNVYLVVNRLGGPPPSATKRAPLALLTTAGVVVLAASGALGVAESALLGAGVLIGTRTLGFREGLRAINWGVVLMIGAAFGIGAAVEGSGLADTIADGLVGALGSIGDAALVFGLLLAAMVLTELVSNSAAAVLIVPIALVAADQAGLDPMAVAIGVAVAASCSFVTPIGYQTNTMVMGPGDYRFTDYARLGVPLAIAVLITATVMVLVLSA